MSAICSDIFINASRARVWEVLSAPSFMSRWAGVFGDDSPNFSGEWKEGGELRGWDKNGDGIVSRLVRCEPELFAEFEHVAGLAKGEKCELAGDAAEWKGLRETYALADESGGCKLSVRAEPPKSAREFLTEKWPLVMAKIKELSETDDGN